MCLALVLYSDGSVGLKANEGSVFKSLGSGVCVLGPSSLFLLQIARAFALEALPPPGATVVARTRGLTVALLGEP